MQPDRYWTNVAHLSPACSVCIYRITSRDNSSREIWHSFLSICSFKKTVALARYGKNRIVYKKQGEYEERIAGEWCHNSIIGRKISQYVRILVNNDESKTPIVFQAKLRLLIKNHIKSNHFSNLLNLPLLHEIYKCKLWWW